MKAKMNIRARNKLLDILEEKGIEIQDLEEAIEEAYENYYELIKEEESSRLSEEDIERIKRRERI